MIQTVLNDLNSWIFLLKRRIEGTTDENELIDELKADIAGNLHELHKVIALKLVEKHYPVDDDVMDIVVALSGECITYLCPESFSERIGAENKKIVNRFQKHKFNFHRTTDFNLLKICSKIDNNDKGSFTEAIHKLLTFERELDSVKELMNNGKNEAACSKLMELYN